MKRYLGMGAIFMAMISQSVFGQTNNSPSQIQRAAQPGSPTVGPADANSTIKNIPELYPGESSDFGTQQLVEVKSVRKWFELNLDWQATYDDNYLLATLPSTGGINNGKVASSEMVSTWDFALAPDPFLVGDYKLSPRLGFRQSFWNYGFGTNQQSNFSAFDFDTHTVYGEVRADLGQDWNVTVGADWTRINSWFSNSEIYRQYGPRWGASKLLKVDDRNFFIIGVDQQYLLTDLTEIPIFNLGADLNDRFNTTFNLTYVWLPIDHLSVTPYYRMTHSYYPQFAVANPNTIQTEDRSDFLNTFGINTAYQFNEWISARLMFSYDKRFTTYSNPINDPTNVNVPEYERLSAGMGGAVTIRF